MKALVIEAPGRVTLTEVPEPALRPGHVLLKIETVGMCGTDLSSFRGKNPLVRYPRIPGHDHLVTLLGVLPPADSAEEAAPEAAVSVCLAPDPHGAATVLLIKRAEHPLDPWSGHIGLPGGRRETDDLDVLATARREKLRARSLGQ